MKLFACIFALLSCLVSHEALCAPVTAAQAARAVSNWLARHGDTDCRFDCILIDGERLDWVRDAFSADA